LEQIQTKYGLLSEVSAKELYPDGALKGVVLSSSQPLATPYGRLIPQYQNDGARRKFTHSLMFYPNGDLHSVSLQKQTFISTPLGDLPAERLTFYENGALKRLFPLNGQLSGFWTEANEYSLAEPMTFNFPFAVFSCKVISILFFDTGAVKSVTFWPKETATLAAKVGLIPVRIGFSLYPDGNLASLEPLEPTLVSTPIGLITAFNVNATGIHADANSLCFNPDGQIESLITSSDRITVTDLTSQTRIFQPKLKPSLLFEGKQDLLPLKINLNDTTLCFTVSEAVTELERNNLKIKIENLPFRFRHACSDCTGCDGCG
jgi:hypothetical protein